MTKREPSLSTQYRRVLSKIRSFVNENPTLLDNPSYINLMYLCVDPYDNEHEFYGIRRDEKGKIFFCFSSGHTNSERGYPLNITDFAKKLESHRDFPTVTPQTLRENFLTNVKEPLRNSMITKAKVDEKVQKRLNALEQALED